MVRRATRFSRSSCGDSPLDFVISMNLKRRQLTASQKAIIAADALPQFEKEAKKRQGERTDKHPDKNVRKSEPEHRARDDAAKAFRVNPPLRLRRQDHPAEEPRVGR